MVVWKEVTRSLVILTLSSTGEIQHTFKWLCRVHFVGFRQFQVSGELVSPTVWDHPLENGHVCGVSYQRDNCKHYHHRSSEASFTPTAYWNSETVIYSLQICKKFFSNPWPAKFWQSNLKLSVFFHTISPHLTSAMNFNLLGLFWFYSTSANVAQKDKTAACCFSSSLMGCISHLETSSTVQKQSRTQPCWLKKSIVFIYFMLFINSTFNFLFNSAESVCLLLNQFVNSWHLQCP